MAEMISIGNKICSKEHGYPYAVLEDNETWYLYDHIKNSGTYVKVKEIWRGTTEQDIEEVKEALVRWGWSDTGFEPTGEELCY